MATTSFTKYCREGNPRCHETRATTAEIINPKPTPMAPSPGVTGVVVGVAAVVDGAVAVVVDSFGESAAAVATPGVQ